MSESVAAAVAASEPSEAAQAFVEYTKEEGERRRNSGDDFDEDLFQQAVDLVLRRLQTLHEEGVL